MRVSYQFSEKFMLKRQSERVAQAVEHVTFNHGVVGSSPTALTNDPATCESMTAIARPMNYAAVRISQPSPAA